LAFAEVMTAFDMRVFLSGMWRFWVTTQDKFIPVIGECAVGWWDE